MAPPTKTTGLPESSLIIAPNKNKAVASKKRRRPAFRPGQRAASKTTSSKKQQDTAPATKKKKSAGGAAVETEKNTTAAQPTNELTNNTASKEVEKITQEQQEILPKKDKVAKATKTAASTTKASAPEEPKTSSTGTSKSDAPAYSSNNVTKEKPAKAVPKSRSASARQLKAKLPPKALTKKAPLSILHGKKKSTTTTIPTNESAATKKKTATSKAKAIAPLKPGRARKSTGLVLAGASRIEAKKKDPPNQQQQFIEAAASKEKHTDGTDNDGMPSLQNAKAVSATAITAAATAPVPTGEGQFVPPPKEGEALLGQFCSKFRVKNKGDKLQAKKKKDQEAKTNNLSNQRGSEDDKEEEEPTAGPVVQIIDGEIVLQESSMVVERGGAAGLISSNRSNRNEEDEYAVVEEDNEMAVVGASYNSFVSRKSKPQHWTLEETKLFYEALRQVGTDFMLMSEFYPSRNRKQLKKKYQREYTKNAKLVELALHPSQQKPLDLTIFQVNQTEVQEQVEVIKLKEIEDAAKAKEDAAKAKEDAAKAKEAEEKRIQDEIDNPPVVENKNAGSEIVNAADKENGMEVIVEDEGDMPHATSEGGKASSITLKDSQKANEEEAAVEEPEADEEGAEKGEALWPDARNLENVFGEGEEFDENIVVEEDPMILEEYQYGDEFDEASSHDNGGEKTGDNGKGKRDVIEKQVEEDAEGVNAGAGTAAAESTPAENPEVPTIPSPAAAPRNQKPIEPALSLLLTAKKKKTSSKKPKFRSARPVKKKK